MNIKNMKIEYIWKQIEEKINENKEIIRRLQGTYSFEIDDGEKKYFNLICHNDSFVISRDKIDDYNCQLSMKEKHFKRLLIGDLKATSAFMTGRLKVKGNIADALKLDQLFKQYT